MEHTASVYVLHSQRGDCFYTGYSKQLARRLAYHRDKEFCKSFSTRYNDWELFLSIDNLQVSQARKIEVHLKRMKSKKYIICLKKYPEMIKKLIEKYSKDALSR